VSLAVSLFLAGLLSLSALHKVVARERMGAAAARLAWVSPALGQPLLFAAAAVELLAAIALLAPGLTAIGALTATGLWLVYGLTLAGRHGQSLDCGCDLFAREKPVDLFAVIRPLVLAVLAIWVALVPAAPFTPDAPFAALGFLALWFAAGELAVLPHLARISRR